MALKYYLTSSSNVSSDVVTYTISCEPSYNNSSHRVVCGWLGTSNDIARYAHDAYDTLNDVKGAAQKLAEMHGLILQEWMTADPCETDDWSISAKATPIRGNLVRVDWYSDLDDFPSIDLQPGVSCVSDTDPNSCAWYIDALPAGVQEIAYDALLVKHDPESIGRLGSHLYQKRASDDYKPIDSDDYELIAQVLQDHGYETEILHGENGWEFTGLYVRKVEVAK